MPSVPDPTQPDHPQVQDDLAALSLCVQLLPHPFSPILTLSARTKDDVRQLLRVLARMVIVDNPYPLQITPRTVCVWHLLQRAMVIIARVIAVIGHIDQAQPLAIDLAEN